MIPAAALLDTSVLLRLMVDQEDELQAGADAIADAIAQGRLEPLLLDLSVYEAINVLIGKLGIESTVVEDQLGDIFDAGWPVVAIERDSALRAAHLADEFGLSGYDAGFIAATERLGVMLISADAAMLGAAGRAGLALWDIAAL